MQTILVATDGSPHSDKAVREAARLSKALNLKLELVNVLPPILLPPSVYAETIAKVEEGNKLAADRVLKAAKVVAKEEGVEADTVMLNGAPAEAIAELAQAERVWGIAIGAKGHSAVVRALLGSVTDRLVHISPKPVLVVH